MPPEIQTQISSGNEEKAMRMAEIERKRMELRRRMEEASKARRAKKSFMTPERKKKLRLLLRRKAAEELKKEQERKAEERRWTIEERCGEPEDMEWASKEDLIDICEYYYQRILDIESEKWDIELDIRRKHFEIVDINSKVNDLRGKFQRPILKKVSKYENRFAKLQRKAAEFNFRNQLKLVRRHEFMLKDDDKKGHHADKRFRDHKHEEQSEVGTETLADDDLTSVDDVGSVTEVDDRFEADEGLRLDSRASGIEEEHLLEAEEVIAEERTILEASEELAGDESRLEDAAVAEEESHIEGEVTAEGELRLEGNVSVDGEPRLEGNVSVDGEPRLEGDLTVEGEPMLEGEATVDGESRLEGDIIDRELRQDDEATAEGDLRLEGQVVPDDEDILPPDSPEPVHTEEDLWLYLKENVSSEHPSTVEEFVRNLIGTLQHVPEEYLKPVIDANIKRANSPSVTDGEHPPSPEGVRPEEGTSNVNPLETSDSPSGASTQEVSSEFPGVSSAVEATD